MKADPFAAIPAELRSGLEDTLKLSLSTVTKTRKIQRFSRPRAEDALTWVVFRFLQEQRSLRQLLGNLGIASARNAHAEPLLLLWGVPVPLVSRDGLEVHCRLRAALDAIGEAKNARTEPDVMLDFGKHGLVIIEVKLDARNERRSADYAPWDKYFDATEAFRKEGAVRESGLYELARNWRVGWELTREPRRRFTLLNLGPESLFRIGRRDLPWVGDFGSAINQPRGDRFMTMSWPQFLQHMPAMTEPVAEFVKSRVGAFASRGPGRD